MNGTVRIAPSILSADFAALGAAIAAVETGGADLIHVDVMDGHFVPNITIGPPVVKSVKRVARVPLDVHLMITDPDRYAEAFVEAGADMLSVHVEVLPHLHRTITLIKSLGVKAGVVLNPSTPVGRDGRDRRRRRLRARHVGESRASADRHSSRRSLQKVAAVRALLDRAGKPRPDRDRRRHRSRPTSRASSRRASRSSSPARRFSTRPIPPQPPGRCKDAAARGRSADEPTKLPQTHRHPRPLRRDRQDGRGLSRELFRVVRSRPVRAAARRRAELSRDGGDRRRPAGHRSALRIQVARALRRRAAGEDAGRAAVAGAGRVRLRDQPADRRHGECRSAGPCTRRWTPRAPVPAARLHSGTSR